MLQDFIHKARRKFGSRSNFQVAEQFGFSVNNGDYIWTPNRVVNQGLNYILNAAFRGEGVLTTWYIAPYAANVTPAANLTAATVTATLTEFTNYDEANRVTWVTDGASSAQTLVNDTAPALFTIGAGGQTTMYGAFLVSAQGKSATTGTLAAAGLLGTALTGLADGFEVRIKYRITGTSS